MKTLKTQAAAEKFAASRSKKTGLNYEAFAWGEGWVVMTEEEFRVAAADEPSNFVEGGFEAIDTDPVEQVMGEAESVEQVEEAELMAMLLAEEAQKEMLLAEEQLPVVEEQVEQPVVEQPVVEQPVVELTKEELKAEAMEALKELKELDAVEEKKEPEFFAPKPGYTTELTIPYFGIQQVKKGQYLKTADPQGNRIRLADSRCQIVQIEGEVAVIKTTPTYAAHRHFI